MYREALKRPQWLRFGERKIVLIKPKEVGDIIRKGKMEKGTMLF